MLLFLKVLLTEFIAEMGDKTQLMLVALTSKYKLRDIILGTAAAILVLNGMAVLAGGLVGELIPDWLIKLVAALAFMYFAVTSLKKDDDDEEEAKTGKIGFAPLAVFCTFFVAELGDKTQLTAITFGANEGLSAGIIVWLGCSIGLFAADIIGMLIGYLLKSKTPDNFLNMLAFVIFAIFGVFTLRQGLLLEGCPVPAALTTPLLIVVTIVFAAVCVLYYLAQRRHQKEKAR
jgi:putative Ca2+/H+ antiporter (TMEM165/GDT1 family)